MLYKWKTSIRMHDIKQYFTSPIKMDLLPLKDNQINMKKLPESPLPSGLNQNMPSPSSSTTSKLIVSTMESVISSVKKQRKAKKKKRETIEPDISDISSILSTSLSFVSPTVSTSVSDGEVTDAKNMASIGKSQLFILNTR